jgi:hypothetical protein
MALSFPNTSRSFDAAGQSVCFWGHDSAFESLFTSEWMRSARSVHYRNSARWTSCRPSTPIATHPEGRIEDVWEASPELLCPGGTRLVAGKGQRSQTIPMLQGHFPSHILIIENLTGIADEAASSQQSASGSAE